MAKSESKSGTIIAIVAIIAFVVLGLAWLSQPTTVKTNVEEASAVNAASTPAPAVAQPGKVALDKLKGTFSITPTDQGGNTPSGTSSIMLLLDASYWNTDERTTRHAIMKIIADSGINSLKYYTGAPESKTHNSGSWSWTVYPKAYRSGNDIFSEDKAVLFSYFDTSPAIRENKSQARVLSFGRYNPSTETWSASFQDGSTTFSLYSYAQYNITNTGSGTPKGIYNLSDGGSVLTNQGVTWQTNSSAVGEELVDGAVFVIAPKNFTNTFRSITITAKSLKPGYSGDSSVQYSAGDLLSTGFPDNIAKIINALPPEPTSNDAKWFVGYIPDRFDTLRTSADSKEMTWKVSTDTYGSPVNATWFIVQNAHALSGNNNAGIINTIPNGFILNYNTAATSNTGFP